MSNRHCRLLKYVGVTVAIAPHFGIRYTNDLTDEFSEFIVDSVDLLNAQLARYGLSFFFDTIDADQRVIGGRYCEDMFGWVIQTAWLPNSSRFGSPARTRSSGAMTTSARAGKTVAASRMR